jgi:hypothetical protein
MGGEEGSFSLFVLVGRPVRKTFVSGMKYIFLLMLCDELDMGNSSGVVWRWQEKPRIALLWV